MSRLVSFSVAVALATGSPPPAFAQAHIGHHHPPGAKIIMYGTIIDPSCRFTLGLSGSAHRECAAACANRGVSLVLLGEDDHLYILTASGKPAAGQNSRVKSFLERRVKLMGTVFPAGDSHLVAVDSVSAASS
jgi:hypothetical protein